MKIVILDSYEALSRHAAAELITRLEIKRNLLLCTATGSSPTGVYSYLKEAYQRRPELFESLNIIKLDEWGGVPMDDPGTCESYLRKHLTKPLQIDASRYISFNSVPESLSEECKKIQNRLDLQGRIDVCMLGLGMNGHVALNEPADFLEPDIHAAALSSVSLTHNMLSDMNKKPSFGLTLGMKAILDSNLILMLVSGKKKKEIAKQFLSGKISTQLPASFLWLHPNAICFIDRDAFTG